MSRVAYVDVFSDERGPTCAGFLRDAAAWFAPAGMQMERVMTDNAKNYTRSHDFQAALSDIRAQHKRTRPRRPQTNGKSERFNRTLLGGLGLWRPSTRTTSACSRCQNSSTATTTTDPHRAERANADGGPRQQRVRESHFVTNRRERRARRRTRTRPAAQSRTQTRYRILVLLAVVGLVLLAVASAALVSPSPAPTSFV